MIPVRLQVRNFLCYRDNVPLLDFTGIHVACLSGANGHGKSALLDAVTWALWGKARARQDDQLIHQGESEMEVQFEFLLDGDLYRVIRGRSAKGRGSSSLELQVKDDGGFRVLTESSMRATQKRINQILRMDYDTFINSAFLLQGRADEFTVKAPSERKQVLADILGLALYDRAEEIAKERARKADQDMAELNAQLREIDRELANLPTYQKEEKEYALESGRLAQQREDAEALLDKAQARLNELQLQQRDLQRVKSGLAEDQRALENRRAGQRDLTEKMAQLEALIGQAGEIEDGYQRLQKARADEAAMAGRAIQAGQLTEQAVRLEGAIAQAKQKIELELQQADKRAEDLRGQIDQTEPLRAKLAQVQNALSEMEAVEAEREAHRQRVQDIGLEVERLKAETQQLRKEMDDLKAKIDELSEAEAQCPLCRQSLSEDNRQRLMDEMTAEGQEARQRFLEGKEQIQSLEKERQDLQKEVAALDAQLKGKAHLQREEAALTQAVAQAEGASEELERLDETRATFRESLERGDYAAEEQARLREVEEELRNLGYDAREHAALREQVQSLAEFDAQHAQLADARERIGLYRGESERLGEEIAALEKKIDEAREQEQALTAALADLPSAERDFQQAKSDRDNLVQKERIARDRLAAARQKLDYCEGLAAQREEKAEALTASATEKGVYEDLRLAFGKKGIQAMIIESVIPEIQDEANQLLRRMTDGKMAVKLETQRDTKSGSTVETLDIHISDELGPRPYELFSGGEAFRVNFAIRIALSKLLARRAGAQLRTLIVDEGFGSQDADGRQKLVEAIQSIQEDFEKILVITHVEELRDAFPTRIHVEKTAAGSTFTIM